MERLESHLATARALIGRRELPIRRRLSQHFLLSAPILRRVVAAAGDIAGREVLEIGPGPGGLTAALLDAGARVTALELDREWSAFTSRELADAALTVRAGDAAELAAPVVAELAARGGRPPLVVSNLPFAVASRLLVDLVRASPPPERLVVMVQREVAERLVAPPATRSRGLLTLLVALRARVRREFLVAAGSFTPPPKVQSAVVSIVPDAALAAAAAARPRLEPLLRAAFSARRKMLRSALAGVVPAPVLATLPADLTRRRPEELADAEWLELADAVDAPAPG